ncbi:lysis protein [Providencia hangzhouensis]|nr:lysis protein [Providencia rettgeri]ELR5210126.1 lysis protein [Providencia rettgeri]ELR5249026.1 lysis protein [Providencia rettgeri]
MNWKATAIALIGVIVLGGLLNWEVSKNQKLTTSLNESNSKVKQLTDELSEQKEINADYEKRINSLHELDTKHTTELTNAKTEIDQLRIAAERNPERVYIRASCPKGETDSTSGLDDGAAARPTDSAIGNYWLLRQRIAESKQMTLGLQDYIRTECLR